MDTVNNKAEELYGKEILDNDGDKIGKIENIYLDDNTSAVKWLTIKTGLFGTKHAFVPVEALRNLDGELVLPYDKEFVKNAPHLDADKHISPEEENELYRYYNIGDRRGVQESSTHNENNVVDGEAAYVGKHEVHDNVNEHREDTAVRDHSFTDRTERDEDGVVLHEERVNVGTERVDSGEARLHKTVVTEEQSVDVPVTREEAHIVREPLNEVVTGHELKDEAVAVTLHEERPVVEKETVAVERVSLDTEEVRENKTVAVETAHEEVKLENDVARDDLHGDRDDFTK